MKRSYLRQIFLSMTQIAIFSSFLLNPITLPKVEAGNTGNGESPNLAVTKPDTILNKYALLSKNAQKGDTTISLSFDVGEGIPTIDTLEAGDLLFIIQAQGATIDTSNTAQYGNILSFGGAGLFEIVTVKSYDPYDQIVELQTSKCGGLKNNYQFDKGTQVVYIPTYKNLTIADKGVVIAPFWNGRAGGIVAIKAEKTEIEGKIDVTGRGFRKGADHLTEKDTTGANVSIYVSSDESQGGEKGESIAGYQTDYDSLGGRYGRGAPANGGGGGNAHNSSGGGGGNGDNQLGWNGHGVMDPAYLTAWKLDPRYVANSNQLTQSAGGGQGGYSFSVSSVDPFLVGPGNSAWSGDNRREVGGLGGRALIGDGKTRIFFGGGGGAGDRNSVELDDDDETYQNVGNGGGIVYLISTKVHGKGKIEANGFRGQPIQASSKTSWSDATGGAGAGGTIVVRSPDLEKVSILAQGGSGGTQTIISPGSHDTEAEGGGGGGGGGAIFLLQGNMVTSDISGGAAGTTNSKVMSKFPVNGATKGGSGILVTYPDFNDQEDPICTATDLAVDITTTSSVAQIGQPFEYTIVVHNYGPTDVTNAPFITSLLPTLADVTWTCSPLALCGTASGSGDIFSSVTLKSGEQATYVVHISTIPSPRPADKLTFTATILPPMGVTDTNLINNSKRIETPISTEGSEDPGNTEGPDLQIAGGGFVLGCAAIPGSSSSLVEIFLYSTVLIVSRLFYRYRRAK